MTSTNDGKDVKSNQTSGHKEKTYFIELYKSLDARLTAECTSEERALLVSDAWLRIHSLCLLSTPATHPHLSAWLQRHTSHIILQTEWQLPDNSEYHTWLVDAIDSFSRECENAISKRGGLSLSWESHLLQRAAWFRDVLSKPWDHRVLKALLDSRGPQPTHNEVVEWLKDEQGVMFVARLRQLAASKCDDLALLLAAAVMDKVRLDADQAEDSKDKPEAATSESSFESVLRTDAGFTTEVWDLLTDIEFVLLYKGEARSRCIDLAKQTPLRNAYQIVERLHKRLENSPQEKKLWKNAKDVATLIAQVVIARCMVVPSCTGVARAALYSCVYSLVQLLPADKLPPAAAALAAPAATSRHLHTLAHAVHAQCKEERKPFVCSLYVRAITAGMNELENLKVKTAKESEARSIEQTLASWFIQLGSLLSASTRLSCECILTAFSVHPSPPMYDMVKRAPPLAPLHKPDVQEQEPGTSSEFGSWATDSRTQTNLVKTSETLNLKQTQKQANVLSTAIFTEGEALGLEADLCQDLAVLLSGPRVKTLYWDLDREVLLENCRTYMERTHGGTRALTTELKYLNLDPSSFQHLPEEEEEDENDIYYGIEKGYEHLVEFEEPEDICEEILSNYSETSDSDSLLVFDIPKRKKKSKHLMLSSEEEVDPLSLDDDQLKGDHIVKREERPHSKERSKHKSKERSKSKAKMDCKELGNNELSDEKMKELQKKEKTKERKERKKKEKLNMSEMNLKQKDFQSCSNLSRLIGMKVGRVPNIKNPEIRGNIDLKHTCITDSDYDSQGKSSITSITSESNENVLFDGLYPMEDIKCDDSQRTDFPSYPYTSQNTNAAKEDVKRGIQKLIEYRQNKVLNEKSKGHGIKNFSSNLHSSKIRCKDSVSNTPNSSFSNHRVMQFQTDQSNGSKIYTDTNNERNFTSDKNILNMSLKSMKPHNQSISIKGNHLSEHSSPVIKQPVPQSETSSQKQYREFLLQRRCDDLQEQFKKRSDSPSQIQFYEFLKKQTIDKFPVSSCNNTPKDKNHSKPPPDMTASQKQFHNFLKELQQTINAGATNKDQVSKSSQIIDKTCSKKNIQPKKVDNALNTFSRLSYMHKNKQCDSKSKPANNQIIRNKPVQTITTEEILHLKDIDLEKFSHLQSKGEVVISKVDKIRTTGMMDANAKVLVQKVENPPVASISPINQSKQYPIISNMLSTDMKSNNVVLGQVDNGVNKLCNDTATPKPTSSLLSEKDQVDILLLLRQQSKMNQHVMPVRNDFPKKSPSNISSVLNHNLNTERQKHYNMSMLIQELSSKSYPTSVIKVSNKPLSNLSEPKKNRGSSGKSLSKQKVKNDDGQQSDWKSVMDDLLAQKTPSRGPNALDIVLKKDSFDKRSSESLSSHNQRSVITSRQSSNKMATTDNILVNSTGQTSSKPSTTDSSHGSKLTPLPDFKQKQVIIRPCIKSSCVETLRMSQEQTSEKHFSSVIQNTSDPFISGIPNSDYDLLEELMDDDLRQEIRELSSDEDAYRTSNLNNSKMKISYQSKESHSLVKGNEDVESSFYKDLTSSSDSMRNEKSNIMHSTINEDTSQKNNSLPKTIIHKRNFVKDANLKKQTVSRDIIVSPAFVKKPLLSGKICKNIADRQTDRQTKEIFKTNDSNSCRQNPSQVNRNPIITTPKTKIMNFNKISAKVCNNSNLTKAVDNSEVHRTHESEIILDPPQVVLTTSQRKTPQSVMLIGTDSIYDSFSTIQSNRSVKSGNLGDLNKIAYKSGNQSPLNLILLQATSTEPVMNENTTTTFIRKDLPNPSVDLLNPNVHDSSSSKNWQDISKMKKSESIQPTISNKESCLPSSDSINLQDLGFAVSTSSSIISNDKFMYHLPSVSSIEETKIPESKLESNKQSNLEQILSESTIKSQVQGKQRCLVTETTDIKKLAHKTLSAENRDVLKDQERVQSKRLLILNRNIHNRCHPKPIALPYSSIENAKRNNKKRDFQFRNSKEKKNKLTTDLSLDVIKATSLCQNYTGPDQKLDSNNLSGNQMTLNNIVNRSSDITNINSFKNMRENQFSVENKNCYQKIDLTKMHHAPKDKYTSKEKVDEATQTELIANDYVNLRISEPDKFSKYINHDDKSSENVNASEIIKSTKNKLTNINIGNANQFSEKPQLNMMNPNENSTEAQVCSQKRTRTEKTKYTLRQLTEHQVNQTLQKDIKPRDVIQQKEIQPRDIMQQKEKQHRDVKKNAKTSNTDSEEKPNKKLIDLEEQTKPVINKNTVNDDDILLVRKNGKSVDEMSVVSQSFSSKDNLMKNQIAVEQKSPEVVERTNSVQEKTRINAVENSKISKEPSVSNNNITMKSVDNCLPEKLVFDELPGACNGPLKRSVRIKLPNGKTYKATISGKLNVNIDSIFDDPKVKSLLWTNINNNSKCTLNIKQICTHTRKNSTFLETEVKHVVHPRPVHTNPETINLISDDEDTSPLSFKTEFGNYNIAEMDTNTYRKHQKKFLQKSVVLLERCYVQQAMVSLSKANIKSTEIQFNKNPIEGMISSSEDNIVDPLLQVNTQLEVNGKLNELQINRILKEKMISPPKDEIVDSVEIDPIIQANTLLNESHIKNISKRKLPPSSQNNITECIEIDDSSDDSVDYKPSCEKVTNGSKETNLSSENVDVLRNLLLKEFGVDDNIQENQSDIINMNESNKNIKDIAPASQNIEIKSKKIILKLKKCDDLVEKLRIKNLKCFVNLVRCDNILQNFGIRTDVFSENKITEEVNKLCLREDAMVTDTKLRRESVSILNELLSENLLDYSSPSNEENSERISPSLIDNFEIQLNTHEIYSSNNNVLYKKCYADWFMTKSLLHKYCNIICDLSRMSSKELENRKECDDSITDCDSDVDLSNLSINDSSLIENMCEKIQVPNLVKLIVNFLANDADRMSRIIKTDFITKINSSPLKRKRTDTRDIWQRQNKITKVENNISAETNYNNKFVNTMEFVSETSISQNSHNENGTRLLQDYTSLLSVPKKSLAFSDITENLGIEGVANISLDLVESNKNSNSVPSQDITHLLHKTEILDSVTENEDSENQIVLNFEYPSENTVPLEKIPVLAQPISISQVNSEIKYDSEISECDTSSKRELSTSKLPTKIVNCLAFEMKSKENNVSENNIENRVIPPEAPQELDIVDESANVIDISKSYDVLTSHDVDDKVKNTLMIHSNAMEKNQTKESEKIEELVPYNESKVSNAITEIILQPQTVGCIQNVLKNSDNDNDIEKESVQSTISEEVLQPNTDKNYNIKIQTYPLPKLDDTLVTNAMGAVNDENSSDTTTLIHNSELNRNEKKHFEHTEVKEQGCYDENERYSEILSTAQNVQMNMPQTEKLLPETMSILNSDSLDLNTKLEKPKIYLDVEDKTEVMISENNLEMSIMVPLLLPKLNDDLQVAPQNKDPCISDNKVPSLLRESEIEMKGSKVNMNNMVFNYNMSEVKYNLNTKTESLTIPKESSTCYAKDNLKSSSLPMPKTSSEPAYIDDLNILDTMYDLKHVSEVHCEIKYMQPTHVDSYTASTQDTNSSESLGAQEYDLTDNSKKEISYATDNQNAIESKQVDFKKESNEICLVDTDTENKIEYTGNTYKNTKSINDPEIEQSYIPVDLFDDGKTSDEFDVVNFKEVKNNSNAIKERELRTNISNCETKSRTIIESTQLLQKLDTSENIHIKNTSSQNHDVRPSRDIKDRLLHVFENKYNHSNIEIDKNIHHPRAKYDLQVKVEIENSTMLYNDDLLQDNMSLNISTTESEMSSINYKIKRNSDSDESHLSISNKFNFNLNPINTRHDLNENMEYQGDTQIESDLDQNSGTASDFEIKSDLEQNDATRGNSIDITYNEHNTMAESNYIITNNDISVHNHTKRDFTNEVVENPIISSQTKRDEILHTPPSNLITAKVLHDQIEVVIPIEQTEIKNQDEFDVESYKLDDDKIKCLSTSSNTELKVNLTFKDTLSNLKNTTYTNTEVSDTGDFKIIKSILNVEDISIQDNNDKIDKNTTIRDGVVPQNLALSSKPVLVKEKETEYVLTSIDNAYQCNQGSNPNSDESSKKPAIKEGIELEKELKDTEEPEKVDSSKSNELQKNVTLVYNGESNVILKGSIYEDPVIGTCYVFPVINRASLSQEFCNKHNLKEGESRGNLKILFPKLTYSRQKNIDNDIITMGDNTCRKRKLVNYESKLHAKRYRKGKNIDYPKLSAVAILESAYSKEYKRLLNYCSSIKFSYSRPFHKEHIDVPDLLNCWPIKDTTINAADNTSFKSMLFSDQYLENKVPFDPLCQTLTEEITQCTDENQYVSDHINENNFNMGFGEGSDRVIHISENENNISKVSAATLSDVKQSQPFLTSEFYGECIQNHKFCMSNKHQIEFLKRSISYIELRNKVRSFFKKTTADLNYNWLTDNVKNKYKMSINNFDILSNFPYDLINSDFIEPAPVETVVQVVQVGQLPVSAAAQNPVTCDPRITQVTDASPHCSLENSLHDDSQSPIKTEYTELTTADLSIPLVQEYNRQMESQESSRVPNIHNEDIPVETEITSIVKTEITVELSPLKEEPLDYNENDDLQTLVNNHVNNVDYAFDSNDNSILESQSNDNSMIETRPNDNNILETQSNDNSILETQSNDNSMIEARSNDNSMLETQSNDNSLLETHSNTEMIYEPSLENRNTDFTSQEKQQNGLPDKSDVLAHAMSIADIDTTPDTLINSETQTLENMLSQKICSEESNATETSATNHSKSSPVNTISLQDAIAQMLPSLLNHSNVHENNQTNTNSSVTSQFLHIVQGKNTNGNQTYNSLVDNHNSVINNSSTPMLHIVQNKGSCTNSTPNVNTGQHTNSYSGLSIVDTAIQQASNQLLHIVNTGTQKNNNTGQLLKRVNLLTNITNVQGSNEQKMVQFVCKSADGKSIHLNAPHQRSMVLRLQPIDSSNIQTNSKTPECQDSTSSSPTSNTNSMTQSKESVNAQHEIKSRSVYEENYAKFIQNSSKCVEKSTSLPKFNQAFGKQVFQDGNQKGHDINANNSNISSINPNSESSECQTNDNSVNMEHIGQMNSPPLLLRKSPSQVPQTQPPQPNLVQQIKPTIAPMNIQTMHGGVIYTRQIPVNIGGGQTINLITVPSTELVDDNSQKSKSDVKFVNQNELDSPIIKIVPQNQSTINEEPVHEDNHNHTGLPNENPQNVQTQNQPVLTQMRIKLPMLSKTPQIISGGRVVRPSFFQIQRNVIGGANQHVYQQLVLTAAPPLGPHTIRLPQTQTGRQAKTTADGQSTSEPQMSSSTLEQLREFDMVLEQVKERSTVQPNFNSNSFSKLHTPSTDTTDSTSVTSTVTESTQQVLYSFGSNQSLNVAYINRKTIAATPTTSTFVRSPDSSGIVESPSSSTHIQIPHTVTSESSLNEASVQSNQPKPAKVGSKSKSRPKSSSNLPNSLKLNTLPPKPSQKPLEDEQTTQRILYILAEYKEQVENSPDKDKPAPRRRSNPPTNPPGSSKRKKSSSSSRRHGARELSPVHTDDTCRTMGSEDSSCGTSQGDCNESCLDCQSPQDSPRKVVRKLTFENETPTVVPPKPQIQRNVIVADGQTITVARGTAGKPATAVLMPANYILPVSMVKGGQQIAIVTNRGPKLLTLGGGEGGATNALLLQRLIGPAGLKPVLTRPGVRHVRLPTAALHNLHAFNFTAATTVQPPHSTASPAPAHTPPEQIEPRANSSPWTDRESQDVKPERESSPEDSEPWNLHSTADPHDYTYEETVRTDNMNRTVLEAIPDRFSPDMEAQRIFDKMFDVDSKKSYIVDSHDDSSRCAYDIDASDCDDKVYHQVVHKKDGSSQRHHRLTHVSAAALRHKYAILEHELRLQKSLSEECEDLGVDSPSASELFPEAELLFSSSPAHEAAQHSHTPQPTILSQGGIPQPDIDDQIATDELLHREVQDDQEEELDVSTLGLDEGLVTVSEDGMQATIAVDQEEFARSHPNTTFHSELTEDEEVHPITIEGLKGRHITSTIFHAGRAPATVLVTAPQTTVISQANQNHIMHNNVKYANIEHIINSSQVTHGNLNLASVLVKDDRLTKFDSILTDSRELHLSNTASAIVHSTGNATQVIRRVCYEDDKRDTRFLMDEPDGLIAGNDAKMIAEDNSRDATLESIAGDVDDINSSPERHTELFWESNSASERSESRRPLDYSSGSEKCCKSPSYDETNSTDSSGVGTHMRLDSVIKDARGMERSGSADGSSADDTHPPLRTYPAKRMYHALDVEMQRSMSGKTRAGESSPDILEVRRRASGRGVVKRGCHCCTGSPAPPRPKKSRQRKPTLEFTN